MLGKGTVPLKRPPAWVDFSWILALVMVLRNPSENGSWQAEMAEATLKLRPYSICQFNPRYRLVKVSRKTPVKCSLYA